MSDDDPSLAKLLQIDAEDERAALLELAHVVTEQDHMLEAERLITGWTKRRCVSCGGEGSITYQVSSHGVVDRTFGACGACLGKGQLWYDAEGVPRGPVYDDIRR